MNFAACVEHVDRVHLLDDWLQRQATAMRVTGEGAADAETVGAGLLDNPHCCSSFRAAVSAGSAPAIGCPSTSITPSSASRERNRFSARVSTRRPHR